MLTYPPPPFKANMTKLKYIIEEVIDLGGRKCLPHLAIFCRRETTTLEPNAFIFGLVVVMSPIKTVRIKEFHSDGLKTVANIYFRSSRILQLRTFSIKKLKLARKRLLAILKIPLD